VKTRKRPFGVAIAFAPALLVKAVPVVAPEESTIASPLAWLEMLFESVIAPVFASVNGGANYTLTVVNATGTITPAPLTITARDATHVVGTPDPAFSASFGPFPGGLGPSALDGTLSFTTNAPAGSPGSFKIFAGGLSSPNFDISFVPGTLLVTAANNSLPPVPFSVDQGNNGTPAFSLTNPALASLIVKVSDGTGSQTGNAGGPSVKGNLQLPTLDENGNPLGPLMSFNSSFIEVCRKRVNLCR
jgi:hypothetical protein